MTRDRRVDGLERVVRRREVATERRRPRASSPRRENCGRKNAGWLGSFLIDELLHLRVALRDERGVVRERRSASAAVASSSRGGYG